MALPVAHSVVEHDQPRTTFPVYPTVTTNGLRPVKFTQTQFGLMPIYDAQELSRYRRENGLHHNPTAGPLHPSSDPPVALLPLSSGGHSPTRLSFSAVAPGMMAVPFEDRPAQVITHDHLVTQAPPPQLQNTFDEYSTTQSPGAHGPDFHPYYLQNPSGQMQEYGGMHGYGPMHDYHPQITDARVQPPPTARLMEHVPAYPGGQYPAMDHITPSGNSAYRAPMQLEPTPVERHTARGPRANPPPHLVLDPNRPTLISQLAGFEHFSEQAMLSHPPGLDYQDARYQDAPPFAHQYAMSIQQQPPAHGLPVVYPASANMSGQNATPAAIHPGLNVGAQGIDDHATRISQYPRRDSLMQTKHETDAQAPLPQLSTDHASNPPVSATALAGRYPSLPMQSAAFTAATGLVVHERSAKTGRKARGMMRGAQGQGRGVLRR
jgi:hypothetical protein